MFRRRQDRQRAVIAVIATVALVLGGVSASAGVLDTTLQRAVYDTALQMATAPVNHQTVIVAIDDASIDTYGRWPLPRRAYADMLDRVSAAGPSVIAFDVTFTEASDRVDDDQALAASIRRAGNVVLAVQGTGEGVRTGYTEKFTRLGLPLETLRSAAADLASVNIHPDDDGKVRDAQLVIEGPDGARIGQFYALPLVAAARHLRADLAAVRRDGDRLILPARLGERALPLDAGGGMPIYYAAPPARDLRVGTSRRTGCTIPGEFCVVSLTDVVSGAVDPRIFTGKVVFVGAHSVSGLADDYATPNSGALKMYGVEIWANATQSIFTNRFPLTKQSFPVTLLSLAVVAIGGVLLVYRFRLFGFLAALLLLVALSFLQLWLFVLAAGSLVGSGIVEVPSIGYLVPAVFWWVIVLGYLLLEEQLALARTRSTFGRFVTPNVARTILEREETGKLALGGEEKRVTVLFGDIRGFTTISEGMTPGVLLDTLNRYFDGMVTIVERYEGTVNKYNGDNIMVIWGAPLEVQDQAKKAVSCALELQRFIQAERAKGGPDVSFGFGINTGPVVAGFLGARGRMEYTVIGDTANVASRLTSSDIARRDQVAVSATTLAELGDDVAYISLGEIAVKGRAEPVACFQIDRIGTVANPNPAPPPEVPIQMAAVAGYH